MWQWVDYDQYVEVVPVGDSREHFAGDECWCNPERIDEPPERPVISHNAVIDLQASDNQSQEQDTLRRTNNEKGDRGE